MRERKITSDIFPIFTYCLQSALSSENTQAWIPGSKERGTSFALRPFVIEAAIRGTRGLTTRGRGWEKRAVGDGPLGGIIIYATCWGASWMAFRSPDKLWDWCHGCGGTATRGATRGVTCTGTARWTWGRSSLDGSCAFWGDGKIGGFTTDGWK